MCKWAWKFCMVLVVAVGIVICFATWSCNEVNKIALSNKMHKAYGWHS